MQTCEDMNRAARATLSRRAVLELGAVLGLALVVALLAILLKETRTTPTPLVMMTPTEAPRTSAVIVPAHETRSVEPAPADLRVRYFNGRPIVPARVIRMKVTAYSPDHRSCGKFADGRTATLHSVRTNGGALVAADPRVLPYGSMLTVPGYDEGRVVPVLDCGGAIKGNRLDVLYPTHAEARQWGVQELDVIVWEYADGKPADDPRKLR